MFLTVFLYKVIIHSFIRFSQERTSERAWDIFRGLRIPPTLPLDPPLGLYGKNIFGTRDLGLEGILELRC